MVHENLVFGFPNSNFENNELCEAFQKGTDVNAYFKAKNGIATIRPLQLLHMDLFGPCRMKSLSGNLYALVVADDYSQYT